MSGISQVDVAFLPDDGNQTSVRNTAKRATAARGGSAPRCWRGSAKRTYHRSAAQAPCHLLRLHTRDIQLRTGTLQTVQRLHYTTFVRTYCGTARTRHAHTNFHFINTQSAFTHLPAITAHCCGRAPRTAQRRTADLPRLHCRRSTLISTAHAATACAGTGSPPHHTGSACKLMHFARLTA